ncbi:MotE family protein [Jannaschia sp. 2305UL9-9]|uniref:MotE family protein n=1 Tax=Jannaschia sp. 2305UL9-9 TaxID=3121638 RepID=UPI00352945D6
MKTLAFGGVIVLLTLSALSRIVSASLSDDGDAAQEDMHLVSSELLCPPSQEVGNLLRQIAQRDAELEEREAAIALREQDMRVARQEIGASLAALTEAEARLEARMYQSDQASETDIARLTEVYEGMKPKEAAILFEAMEAGFASGFLARMRPDAASAVFSNLSPEKAYALSVVMAGRNASAATGGAQ